MYTLLISPMPHYINRKHLRGIMKKDKTAE